MHELSIRYLKQMYGECHYLSYCINITGSLINNISIIKKYLEKNVVRIKNRMNRASAG